MQRFRRLVRKDLAGPLVAAPGVPSAPVLDTSRMAATAVISTQTEDRSRDVVLTRGILLEAHRGNPVVLVEHGEHHPYPVAKSEGPGGIYCVKAYDDHLVGTAYFAQNDPVAAQVYALIDQGVLRGASIGFRPLKYRQRPVDPPFQGERPPLLVEEAELLEWSWTALPDNPECVSAVCHVLGKGYVGGERLLPGIRKSLLRYAPPRRAAVTSGFVAKTAPKPAAAATGWLGTVYRAMLLVALKGARAGAGAQDPQTLAALDGLMDVARGGEPPDGLFTGPQDGLFKRWTRQSVQRAGASQNRWVSDSGKVRYFPSGYDPNKGAEGRAAQKEARAPRVAEAAAHVKDTLKGGEVTEGHVEELYGYLRGMKRDELRDLARELGESTGGLKDELAYKLADRAANLARTGAWKEKPPAEEEKAKAPEPAETAAAPEEPAGGPSIQDSIAIASDQGPQGALEAARDYWRSQPSPPTLTAEQRGRLQEEFVSLSDEFVRRKEAWKEAQEAGSEDARSLYSRMLAIRDVEQASREWATGKLPNPQGASNEPDAGTIRDSADRHQTGRSLREPVGLDGGPLGDAADRGNTGTDRTGDGGGTKGVGSGTAGPVKTPREQVRSSVEDVVARIVGASHTPESLLADQLPKWMRKEDIQAALDDMEREGKVRRHKGRYVAADYRPPEDEIEDEVQDHVGREYAKIPKKDRVKLDYDAWEQQVTAAYREEMGYGPPEPRPPDPHFTGTLTDSQGRTYRFVDGKRVAGEEEPTAEGAAPAKEEPAPASSQPPAEDPLLRQGFDTRALDDLKRTAVRNGVDYATAGKVAVALAHYHRDADPQKHSGRAVSLLKKQGGFTAEEETVLKQAGAWKKEGRPAEVVQSASEPAGPAAGTAAPVRPVIKEDEIPYGVAYSAHYNTSFVPEVRAKQRQKDYVDTLTADYESLEEFADTPEKRQLLASEFERYRQNFRQHYLAYLHASSRVASPMITGPAKFPVAANEKKADAAHRRLTELIDLRKRALHAIQKKLAPEKGPIKSSDPGAVDALRKKQADLEHLHEVMKQANQIVRRALAVKSQDSGQGYRRHVAEFKAGHDYESVRADLLKLGLRPETVDNALKPDFMGRVGFPDYALKNNTGRIKQVKDRIAQITAMHASGPKEEKWGNVTLAEDPDAARIRLTFPGKPDRATIDLLKQSGFRWSPTEGAWQRHLNSEGRRAAESVLRRLGKEKTAQAHDETGGDWEPPAAPVIESERADLPPDEEVTKSAPRLLAKSHAPSSPGRPSWPAALARAMLAVAAHGAAKAPGDGPLDPQTLAVLDELRGMADDPDPSLFAGPQDPVFKSYLLRKGWDDKGEAPGEKGRRGYHVWHGTPPDKGVRIQIRQPGTGRAPKGPEAAKAPAKAKPAAPAKAPAKAARPTLEHAQATLRHLFRGDQVPGDAPEQVHALLTSMYRDDVRKLATEFGASTTGLMPALVQKVAKAAVERARAGGWKRSEEAKAPEPAPAKAPEPAPAKEKPAPAEPVPETKPAPAPAPAAKKPAPARKAPAAKKPAPKKPAPAPAAPAGMREQAAGLLDSFEKLDRDSGGYNLLSLVDLRKAPPLAGMPRKEQDALIHKLRQAGVLSLSTAEGRDGVSTVERRDGINEEGSLLLYGSLRPDAAEKVQRLASGAKKP